MASCCGGNQTSTSTTRLDPDLRERYLALLDRSEDVSESPYVSYGGPRVAGLTGDQQAAFQGIRDASGAFQSDLDEARRQAGIAAMPMSDTIGTFDAAALEKYGDPYNQDVIDATRAEIERSGALARRDLDTRAGTSGGIGAYGPGVRANLERQEQFRNQADVTGRTVAGLKSANFAQAQGQFNTEQNRDLAARQNDAARAAAAAGQYVGIGGAEQGYGLTGAQALYGAGTAQQGQEQRGLDTAYADFLEQRGYPREMTEYLSSIYRGYPSAGSTTTSAPGANPWSQALGLGIAGLGAASQFGLFRRGGRVRGRRMAGGGIVSHSGVMRRRMSRRDYAHGGIAGYAPGGSVNVYGGLSNDDLGRLIDAGNADAYDEYVSRLTRGPGTAQADPAESAPSEVGRPLDLSDLGISGWKGLKMPDWVPDWPGGRDAMAHGDETGGGIDPLPPDYVAPSRYRGQPGVRYRGQPPMDSGIASAGPASSGGPRLPLAPRKPMIGHNGGPPMEESGIAAAFTGGGKFGRGSTQSGGIDDKGIQSIAKTASGADEGSEDAPAWAMPMIIAGLSMAASRNPSVLGAIGEGGIAGLSAYIDQKRADAAGAIEADKIAREVARDEETGRHNLATEDVAAANAISTDAYRQSQAGIAKQRADTYDRRTDAMNKRTAAMGAGGGSATERLVDRIMKANPKMSVVEAIRAAHGAKQGDQAAIERLAQAYAKGKLGYFSQGGEEWDKALAEGRAMYGALGAEAAGEGDPLDLGDDEANPLGLDFDEE